MTQMGNEHAGNARFSLQGKNVLVTGASRGIGKGLAIGFAEAGANVILLARNAERLAAVASEIAEKFPAVDAICVSCDITSVESVKQTVEDVEREHPIHVLVNNAGLNIRTPALGVTEDEWKTIMDTDLRGAFFMAQQVGQHMVERGQGSIINVSSVGGLVALRTGVVYAAAKAGIIQMTKVLAMEWGDKGVRVNGIAPWYFRTPLTEKLLDDPQYLGDIVARTPMRRVGEVDELIGPAVFLASDASTYVTGQTLAVDGGMSIYGF